MNSYQYTPIPTNNNNESTQNNSQNSLPTGRQTSDIHLDLGIEVQRLPSNPETKVVQRDTKNQNQENKTIHHENNDNDSEYVLLGFPLTALLLIGGTGLFVLWSSRDDSTLCPPESRTNNYPDLRGYQDQKACLDNIVSERNSMQMMGILIMAIGGGLPLIAFMIMLAVMCSRRRNYQSIPDNTRDDKDDSTANNNPTTHYQGPH